MLDLLKEKNTERKKQENLLNSQKDNFWNTKENCFSFVRNYGFLFMPKAFKKTVVNFEHLSFQKRERRKLLPFFMPFFIKKLYNTP
jgi:hypothetical protein